MDKYNWRKVPSPTVHLSVIGKYTAHLLKVVKMSVEESLDGVSIMRSESADHLFDACVNATAATVESIVL